MFGGRRNREQVGCIQGSLSRTDRGGLPFSLTELQFAPSYPAGHIYPGEPFLVSSEMRGGACWRERGACFPQAGKGNKGANGTQDLRPQTHVNFERNELGVVWTVTQRGMRVAECCRKAPSSVHLPSWRCIQGSCWVPGTVQQGLRLAMLSYGRGAEVDHPREAPLTVGCREE